MSKQDQDVIFRERCGQLATFLERSPRVKNHFNINKVADGLFETAVRRNGSDYCGTAACVAGWAPSVPGFHGQGLTYAPNVAYRAQRINLRYKRPDGRVFTDMEAVQRFLGLSNQAANWLFYPWRYMVFNDDPVVYQQTVLRAAIARLRALESGAVRLRSVRLDSFYGIVY